MARSVLSAPQFQNEEAAFEYVEGRDLRQIFDKAIAQSERIPVPILLYVFARIGDRKNGSVTGACQGTDLATQA